MVYSTWQIPVFGVTWRNNHITTWCPSPARRSDDMKCISCYVYILYIYIYCEFVFLDSKHAVMSVHVRSMNGIPSGVDIPNGVWSNWRHPKISLERWSMIRSTQISARNMAVCQNLVPLVNIKIAGKWMFIPLKMDRYWSIATSKIFKNRGSMSMGFHGSHVTHQSGEDVLFLQRAKIPCNVAFFEVQSGPRFQQFLTSSPSHRPQILLENSVTGPNSSVETFSHFYTQHTFLWWLHNPRRSKGL